MHRFYVTTNQINQEEITITGPDVNHIKNVLRMKQGDEIVICNGQGKDCYCIISKVSDREVTATIQSVEDTGTELKGKITLFQGVPKKDKMELIIQKAVELGVSEIVPVRTSRVIVKFEDKKKEDRKLERWQSIAESAAKQSRRGLIPNVQKAMTYKEALTSAETMELCLIPYEKAEDISYTRKILSSLGAHSTIGVFIGPEGGFSEEEIEEAKDKGILPLTLGRRILRTETAGITILSMIMLELEE